MTKPLFYGKNLNFAKHGENASTDYSSSAAAFASNMRIRSEQRKMMCFVQRLLCQTKTAQKKNSFAKRQRKHSTLYSCSSAFSSIRLFFMAVCEYCLVGYSCVSGMWRPASCKQHFASRPQQKCKTFNRFSRLSPFWREWGVWQWKCIICVTFLMENKVLNIFSLNNFFKENNIFWDIWKQMGI